MTAIEMGRDVFYKEILALEQVKDSLDGTFDAFVDKILGCKGKVIFIGMGKSGHVAKKIAATMASLGNCSICLHPAECLHGDLGMVQSQDIVILISYSGESEEIIRLIPGLNKIGVPILGITSNGESKLARSCEIVQVFSGIREACFLGLAPTTSTTVVMAYGDALAVTCFRMKKFDRTDFGIFHPSGSLGKSLTTRAVDLMQALSVEEIVQESAKISDALYALSVSRGGCIPVVDEKDVVVGCVDVARVRRFLKNGTNLYEADVKSVMQMYPEVIDEAIMAIDALKIMRDAGLDSLIVVREEHPIGVLQKDDITKFGIYV